MSNQAALDTVSATPAPAEESWLGFGPAVGPAVEGPSAAPVPAPQASARRDVAKGDTLWDIAKQVYGDASRWTEIYEANKGVIGDDPDLILPGQSLMIGGIAVPDVLAEGPTLDAPDVDAAPGVDVAVDQAPEAVLPPGLDAPDVDVAPEVLLSVEAPVVDTEAPSLGVPDVDLGPVFDLPVFGAPDRGVVGPTMVPPELDAAPEVDTTPAVAPEPTEQEIHDARVREILGDAYEIEEGTEAFDAMLEWLDPLGQAPSASDYLTPAMVQAGYQVNSEGKLEYAGAVISGGPNAIGFDGASTLNGLDLAVGAHAAWDQTEVGVQTSGGHYTAAGNALDFLGGPIGSASETDVWDWKVGAGAELRGVSLSGEASGGASDVSAYHTAIQNFPIEGLSADITDPVSMAARQAYIDANPEEFREWMLERREAVLGGAESLSAFDWENLGAGEAVSFSEFGQGSWKVGAGYAGVGVSLGRSEEDAHEVTMAMDDAGMMDVAITAMDQGAAQIGLSALGTLELGITAGEGHVSQVRFRIDTTTPDGRQQAEMFTEFGLLPGALDGLDDKTREDVETYLGHRAAQEDYPFGDSLTPPDIDIHSIVADANAQFLERHEEGDLPIAGSTTYQNMELADIRTSGASVGVTSGPLGLTLLQSSYEQILAENRYRNEQGLTESEFSSNTSIDRGGLSIFGWQPFGDGTQVDSFAITNPEENTDIALFAGVTGDYGHDLDLEDGQQAAYTVTLNDDQMAGLEQYLADTHAAEEALFNEDAAEYYFTAFSDPVFPERIAYEAHDGDQYSYLGNIEDHNNLSPVGNTDAETRAQWTGLSGHVDQLAIELYAEDRDLDPADLELMDVRDLDRYRSTAAGVLDMQFREVTSIDAFRDLGDPALQSAYIQSAAVRLTYEDKNPALAFSLAFELEDPAVRNEVIRDVLAHLPEDGVEYVGSLIEDARAHDPELAVLLEGAIQEGAIERPQS
ncbi:MAG: LysM peptidoglycan-binding domain-containing protein [Myxococcota bacterium]